MSGLVPKPAKFEGEEDTTFEMQVQRGTITIPMPIP